MLYGRFFDAEVVKSASVLILIFLENALRLRRLCARRRGRRVLILIFLENALRQSSIRVFCRFKGGVLILIFLENALRLYGSKIF